MVGGGSEAQKKPLRVLHIGTEKTWRGGENQVLLLLKGLQQKGVECTVAYPKQNALALERFSAFAKVEALPSSRPWDFRSVIRLIQVCRHEHIDLIDAHSSGAHSLALWIKRWCPQVKLIVHRRVDNSISQRKPTQKKYFSSLVDRYVAISQCIGQMLRDYGVSPQKIQIVRSAVDSRPYQIIDKKTSREGLLKKVGLNEEITLLGNASAFTHQKGHDVLLRSLVPLERAQLSFHCFLAGEGKLLSSMVELARELKLSHRVTFLGFIPDVPEFLSGLDILTMPSNNEGLGTLALDGMLARCCVVATRVGGLPEIVVHGQTGILVEKGSSDQLAVQLESLIRDKLKRQKLADSGYEFVREQFSYDHMVEGNLDLYLELTNIKSKK